MVPCSSGTLTFLLLDIEPARCQNGVASGGIAVSLSDVAERPAARAASLSVAAPTGLLADGHNWYLEVFCDKLVVEGLLSTGELETAESLGFCKSLSEQERRGRW
jgi:hypothetical protein